MERRDFIKIGCGVFGVTAAAAFLQGCSKLGTSNTPQGPSVNITLDLTQPANAALKNINGYVYDNSGIIVVKTAATTYVAVAAACTHQGCTIGWDGSSKNFICPCHGGTFDTNGNVVSGPPPAPIKKYTVTINGNILTIAG
jgi:cytochrome b6-f complex iron-sulfur subunit